MPELRRLYNEQVPVIAIDGRRAFRFRVKLERLVREREELLKKLEARR